LTECDAQQSGNNLLNVSMNSVLRTLESWSHYGVFMTVELVCLLLRFLWPTREGHWNLHKLCLREMLPWIFAYDWTNYAQYSSTYLCEMILILLPKTHPSDNAMLKNGNFAVNCSPQDTFAHITVDKLILFLFVYLCCFYSRCQVYITIFFEANT
jgi:hypothetical protein